jgi:hypothetical protein
MRRAFSPRIFVAITMYTNMSSLACERVVTAISASSILQPFRDTKCVLPKASGILADQ